MCLQETPKVSVCVITYNQKNYIRGCLDSILCQDVNFPLEIIVGDDCSCDGTQDIISEFVAKYPEIISAVFQEKNTGGTRNYVDVHRLAKGEYVAHIDGDDIALPSKLVKQVRYLDGNPDCTIVWHSMVRFRDGEELLLKRCEYKSNNVEHYTLCDLMKYGPLGCHSSSMYRRLTRNLSNEISEQLDWMFYAGNLEHGNGALLHEVLGGYRVNTSGSLGTGGNLQKVKKLMVKHLGQAVDIYPQCRKYVFMNAVIRCFSEVRKDLGVFKGFFLLAIKSFSFVSPVKIWELRKIRKMLLAIRFHEISECLDDAEL